MSVEKIAEAIKVQKERLTLAQQQVDALKGAIAALEYVETLDLIEKPVESDDKIPPKPRLVKSTKEPPKPSE